MNRRCESCGKFVASTHLATARYHYSIDWDQPVKVYSLATADQFQERLDCAECSMECCRMREASRAHGVAVGPSLPNGWEPCDPHATQADYALAGDAA